MINEWEDQFMERREPEVRKEMRSQFEMEKRLEKALASKENAENAWFGYRGKSRVETKRE